MATPKRVSQVSEESILAALPYGIGVIEQLEDAGLLLSQANPYLLEIFGQAYDASLPLNLDDITDLPIDTAFCEAMNQLGKGNRKASFSTHLSVGGMSRCFSGDLQRLGAGAGRMLLTLIDFTSEQRHQDDLIHGALHDRLTGLPNYSYFTMKVDELLDTNERPGATAVMMLNLDRFQVINESSGLLGRRYPFEGNRRSF